MRDEERNVLSEYEAQRRANVMRNQERLRGLGFYTDEMRRHHDRLLGVGGTEEKKKTLRKTPAKKASTAEPRRVSGRKKRLLRDNLNDGVVAQRKRRPNHNVPPDEAERKYYEAGARVEIRDSDGGEPWGATVRSEEESLCYEINYDGYDEDELEWVPKDKIDETSSWGPK